MARPGGRGRIVAVGVDTAWERAQLLDHGLGDALGSQVAHVELDARLSRIHGQAAGLPRRIQAGPVLLDLFHRDGRLHGRWLGLHPREFALLWRLAETPGQQVTRTQLLRDVWRLDHVPETNSLEVHVSRLRAKLHVSRCGWLVETHPQGGYRLAADGVAPPLARSA
ncbi:MAG: winged helix-turn-helix domain-containing protein [Qipengyuania sp.]